MRSLQGKKILVVDDDDMMREVLVESLTLDGAQVASAENGRSAYEKVTKDEFDAIISDVRMPGGDGVELAERVLKLSSPKPLMFICSGFNDLNEEKITSLNISYVFEKPIDMDLVNSTVADHLAKR